MMLFEALELFVDSISGSGSHTFFESIGVSSVWIYAHVNMTTNTGFNFSQKLPPDRDSYGQPNANPGNVTTIRPIRGDMTISVSMDGWDHNVSTSDTHLGTVSAQFNADNDFGLNQPRQLNDADFPPTFHFLASSQDNPFDPNFLTSFTCPVHNSRTPTLTTH